MGYKMDAKTMMLIERATLLHRRAKQLGIVTVKDGVSLYEGALDRLEADVVNKEAELGAAVIQANERQSPREHRDMTAAALYLLGCSYGQIMSMMRISQSTIYQAISKCISLKVRAVRPVARGKPIATYEVASAYWAAAQHVPQFKDPVKLAQYIQSEAPKYMDSMALSDEDER